MKKKLALTILGAAIATTAGCISPTSIVIEPLWVINWSPAAGSFCIPTDATIFATFSDQVEVDSLTEDSFFLLDSAGNVPAAAAYDEPNFTATLAPTDALAFSTLYTIVAAIGIRSARRGHLPVELSASFQTLARGGCIPVDDQRCSLPSDCPGTQICANIGICIDECVTSRDCFRGTCTSGACIPDAAPDDGSGDPAPGDPGPGDSSGDAANGD